MSFGVPNFYFFRGPFIRMNSEMSKKGIRKGEEGEKRWVLWTRTFGIRCWMTKKTNGRYDGVVFV